MFAKTSFVSECLRGIDTLTMPILSRKLMMRRNVSCHKGEVDSCNVKSHISEIIVYSIKDDIWKNY